MSERLITQVLEQLPLVSIILGVILTSLFTSGVSYFVPEDSKILRPKYILLIVSILISVLVVEKGVNAGWRSYIAALFLVWSISVAFFEYAGGKWVGRKIALTLKKFFSKKLDST